tara:strand:+ start:194 stop:430 length:237 start_codon:yes stop_codon:yes gene_type:complete
MPRNILTPPFAQMVDEIMDSGNSYTSRQVKDILFTKAQERGDKRFFKGAEFPNTLKLAIHLKRNFNWKSSTRGHLFWK